MTIARAHLIDPSVTRWYHCVTRCVRRAFLLGEGMHDRKSWIEHRLEELAENLLGGRRGVCDPGQSFAPAGAAGSGGGPGLVGRGCRATLGTPLSAPRQGATGDP